MTKKSLFNLIYWVLFAGAGFYFAYAKGWILSDFQSLTPKEAYTLLQSDKEVVLLDVRTPDEFAQGHIEGSTLIPLQTLESNLALLSDAKNKKIIVYCHSGNRSVAASRILVQNGFKPLNMKGGITAWTEAGFDLVR